MDHAWRIIFERGLLRKAIFIGFSRHQGAWSIYSGGMGDAPLQMIGCAFDDPEEAKKEVEDYHLKNGWKTEGAWEKISAGILEDAP